MIITYFTKTISSCSCNSKCLVFISLQSIAYLFQVCLLSKYLFQTCWNCPLQPIFLLSFHACIGSIRPTSPFAQSSFAFNLLSPHICNVVFFHKFIWKLILLFWQLNLLLWKLNLLLWQFVVITTTNLIYKWICGKTVDLKSGNSILTFLRSWNDFLNGCTEKCGKSCFI